MLQSTAREVIFSSITDTKAVDSYYFELWANSFMETVSLTQPWNHHNRKLPCYGIVEIVKGSHTQVWESFRTGVGILFPLLFFQNFKAEEGYECLLGHICSVQADDQLTDNLFWCHAFIFFSFS